MHNILKPRNQMKIKPKILGLKKYFSGEESGYSLNHWETKQH